MLRIKSNTLSKKDKEFISYLFYDICDLYADFYVTKSNIRIPLRDNIDVFYEDISKGDKVIYDDESESAVAMISGYSDNANRKYLKILFKSTEAVSNILKFINWHIQGNDLYIKVKKNNPIIKILQQNNFKFRGNRGQEILMCRQARHLGAKR